MGKQNPWNSTWRKKANKTKATANQENPTNQAKSLNKYIDNKYQYIYIAFSKNIRNRSNASFGLYVGTSCPAPWTVINANLEASRLPSV